MITRQTDDDRKRKKSLSTTNDQTRWTRKIRLIEFRVPVVPARFGPQDFDGVRLSARRPACAGALAPRNRTAAAQRRRIRAWRARIFTVTMGVG